MFALLFRRATPLRAFGLVLLASLSLAAITPAAFGAGSIEGGNSFSELSRKAQEPEQTTSTSAEKTNSTNSTKETKNSKTTILVGFAAAVLLLLAIAYVIVRDARRNAPDDSLDQAELEAKVSHEQAVRLRKRRAKARAARQQRKRTR